MNRREAIFGSLVSLVGISVPKSSSNIKYFYDVESWAEEFNQFVGLEVKPKYWIDKRWDVIGRALYLSAKQGKLKGVSPDTYRYIVSKDIRPTLLTSLNFLDDSSYSVFDPKPFGYALIRTKAFYETIRS
jgi:hypothetical protein